MKVRFLPVAGAIQVYDLTQVVFFFSDDAERGVTNIWIHLIVFCCLLHVNCYFQRTNRYRTGALPISIQSR